MIRLYEPDLNKTNNELTVNDYAFSDILDDMVFGQAYHNETVGPFRIDRVKFVPCSDKNIMQSDHTEVLSDDRAKHYQDRLNKILSDIHQLRSDVAVEMPYTDF